MEKELKLLSEAYDAIYDMNSWFSHEFDDLLVRMNKWGLKQKPKITFVLNHKKQKFEAKEERWN